MKIKKFDWGLWGEKRFESRMPTETEVETLVNMFQDCPWCVIRDILIDSGITDESFPNFFYDVLKGNLQTFKKQ